MEKIITIIVAVDVIGVLANDTLKGNLYLFDNNKANGSSNEGTDDLKTKVTFKPKEEITLLWNVMPLEPESFACISQIATNKEYLKIEEETYPDSDVSYWKGTIIKQFEQLGYNLSLKVGNRNEEFSCNINLIGEKTLRINQ